MSENLDDKNKHRAYTIQAYMRVFESDDGQKVLEDLMEEGFLLRPTSQGAHSERACQLNEGKRELLLYILHMTKYDISSIMDYLNSSPVNKEITNENKDGKEDFDFFND